MVNIEKMPPKVAIKHFYKKLMKIRGKLIKGDSYVLAYVDDLDQEMSWWLTHN